MKWVARRAAVLLAVLVVLGTTAVVAEEIRPEADLAVSKTVSAATAVPGDTLVYSITASNAGPFAAAAVYVIDVLPAGVTLMTSDGCTSAGGTVECNAGLLFAGETAAFTIEVTVDADAPSTITNTATVENREDPETGPIDPDPSNNTDSSTTTVDTGSTTTTTTTSSTTTTTTSAPPTTTTAPPTTTTTTTTTTEAPVPGSIGDTVWLDLDKDGAQDAGEPGIGGVVVVLGGPGGTMRATTDSDGLYLFDDLVRGDYTVALDSGSVPDGFAATTPVSVSVDLANGQDFLDADFGLAPPVEGPAADLSVVKVADASLVNVGEAITFTIIVSNAGPDAATGVAVTDLLGPGLEFVSAAPAAGYDPTSGVWSVGTIAAGADATLGITATVTEAGLLANSAEVTSSDQEDPDSTPDDSAGDDYTNITFQVVEVGASALIGDTVWLDSDGDGVEDAGEVGIAGVTVTLIPAGGSSTTQVTDSTGKYLFAGLDAGDYTVRVEVSTVDAGLALTTVGSFDVTLKDDGSFLDADFGFVGSTTTVDDALPRTGIDTVWLAVIGLVLLLAGAFVVSLSRR